jgi:hypothetical protein
MKRVSDLFLHSVAVLFYFTVIPQGQTGPTNPSILLGILRLARCFSRIDVKTFPPSCRLTFLFSARATGCPTDTFESWQIGQLRLGKHAIAATGCPIAS